MANLSDQQLKETFDLFDADSSGAIDSEELDLVMQALGFGKLHKDDLQDLLQTLDRDNSGVIEFKEFQSVASMKRAQRGSAEEIYLAFRAFDQTPATETKVLNLSHYANPGITCERRPNATSLRVTQVDNESAAKAAGVQVGWWITRVEGIRLDSGDVSVDAYEQALQNRARDDRVEMTFSVPNKGYITAEDFTKVAISIGEEPKPKLYEEVLTMLAREGTSSFSDSVRSESTTGINFPAWKEMCLESTATKKKNKDKQRGNLREGRGTTMWKTDPDMDEYNNLHYNDTHICGEKKVPNSAAYYEHKGRALSSLSSEDKQKQQQQQEQKQREEEEYSEMVARIGGESKEIIRQKRDEEEQRKRQLQAQ